MWNYKAEVIFFFPPYPAWLVTDEADEQGGKFCTSHLRGGGIGDHHEALGAGFPDAPQAVRAQVEELGHLEQDTATLTTRLEPHGKRHALLSAFARETFQERRHSTLLETMTAQVRFYFQ